MGRIPMRLDILILDEIGKNISGAGMDTKVINRGVNGEYNPWPVRAASIERIFVRDLSELTYGNAVGLGMADVVTDRLVNAHRLDAHADQLAHGLHAAGASARRSTSLPTASVWNASRRRWASSTWAR